MPDRFNLRRSQLFLDDGVIEQAVRLRRVVHQPVKYYGNPVYEVGAPWEGTGMVYLAGVHIDPADGLWKAWYVTLSPPAYPEIAFAVCLIVSDDGFTWRRPELDVFPGKGGERTNIVLDLGPAGRTAAPTVLHEPWNEEEPWTMFISLCWPADSMEYRGYFLKSADGIHWRWLQQRPEGLRHLFHDRTTCMQGPDPEKPYVIIGRGKEDIHRWGLPRTAHRSAASLTEIEPGEPTRVIVPDLADDPDGQIYHAYGFPYEDSYVGMFQWYWEKDDPWGEMELLTSRDTVAWQRVEPRTSFLPPSPGGAASGAFDYRITDMALSPPVRAGAGGMPGLGKETEALWFYYWGGAAMHGNRHLTWGRAMGLAQLRIDGFCSLRTGKYPGDVTTKPFTWPGGTLTINATCLGGSGGGRLRIEVLTPDLRRIDGLTREDCDAPPADGTSTPISWNGDTRAVDKLIGDRVRLRFWMENYELYSFKVVEEDA